MGKPIFCILGRSGSGKSTYLDALMNTSFAKDNEIIELKYHTTRSKRSPEEDSYYFTTYEEYKNTNKEDIIESREYQKYDEKVVYYTTKDALDKPNIGEDASLELFGKNIKIVPKLYIDKEVLNYIIIDFDKFSPNLTNPEYRDNMITFIIVCHFDQW